MPGELLTGTKKPLYITQQHGDTWSIYEQDASREHFVPILHNIEAEWQASAIAAILNTRVYKTKN